MFVLLSLFLVCIVAYVCALCLKVLWLLVVLQSYCPFGCTSPVYPVCVVASQNLNAAHKPLRFRIIFFHLHAAHAAAETLACPHLQDP